MIPMYRYVFWATVIVTLVFAWMPHPPTLLPNDKSQHELAFVVLAAAAVAAYPEIRYRYIGAALAALGGLIEVVQAIPALHRDCDIHDWYADVAAICAAMAIIAGGRAFRQSKVGLP